MDKNCMQILAEATHIEINTMGDLRAATTYEEITADDIIEAIKIFGKQCFEAGKKGSNDPTMGYEYEDFDEYLTKLEEGK